MQSLVGVLVTCLLFFSPRVAGVRELAYLPYLELGDDANEFKEGDDKSSRPLSLPSILPFGDSNQTVAFFSSNGLVSFGVEYNEHRPADFPLDTSHYVIAPYWDDIDMRDQGRVVYKSFFNSSADGVLQQVNHFLASNQSLNFRATWVLVARWENTCPFKRSTCPGIKPNTFQVTVATDGRHSYAILTYRCGDLNWIGRTASIGFSAGGGLHANHNLSRTAAVNNISCLNLPVSNWSNVVYTLSLSSAPLNIAILPAHHPLAVLGGTNASVAFNLSGARPDHVIWSYTGVDNVTVNISSLQYTVTDCSVTLHLDRVTLANTGRYTAAVFTRGSSATASVELVVQGAPVLVNSSFPEQANMGDTVQFSCSFSGYPTPTINWRRDGSLILPSSRIAILSSNTSGIHGNLAHSSIIITDLRLADSGSYTCLSINHLVSTELLTFTRSFAVYVPARIVNSSANMTVNETDNAVLYCEAVGFPIPTVIWSKRALGPGNTSATTMLTEVQVETSTEEDGLGVVTSKVTLSPVHLQDRGVYTCHVINTLPNTSSSIGVDISRLSLTVQSVPVVSPAGGPAVIGLEGHSATIRFLVERDHPPVFPDHVEWLFHSAPLNETNQRYTLSPDRLTLTVSDLVRTDEGRYELAARNAAGVGRATVMLDVHYPPIITAISPSQALVEGESIALECEASADPRPSFVWQLAGSGAHPDTQRGNRLLLINVTASDTGGYTCTASNTHGNDSAAVTIQVQVPPLFSVHPSSTVVNLGQPLTLSCNATGFPAPTLHWLKNGKQLELSNSSTLTITTLPTSSSSSSFLLKFTNLSATDTGKYSCLGQNHLARNLSVVSEAGDLLVVLPPVITAGPQDTVTVEGDTVHFSCLVSAIPEHMVEWALDGIRLQGNSRVTIDGQGSGLTVHNITHEDAGHYSCSAANGHGNASATGHLRVQVLVQVILNPPPRVEGIAGSNISISCQARGFPLPNITWLKGSTAVESAAGMVITQRASKMVVTSQLRLSPLVLSHSGMYTCNASNQLAILSVQRSTPSSIHVQYPSSVSVDHEQLAVRELSSAVLHCSGFGVPLPLLSWRRGDGRQIEGRLLRGSITGEDGRKRTMLELHLENITASAGGSYVCSGKNNVTNLISAPEEANLFLTVLVVPEVSSQTGPLVSAVITRDSSRQKNITLSFTVRQASPPVLPQNISWFFNSSSHPHTTRPLLPRERVLFSQDRLSLTITGLLVADAGSYTVRVENGVGTAEKTVQLLVSAEPALVTVGRLIAVMEQENASFTCTATGLPAPVIIWLKNGQPLDDRHTRRISITSTPLSDSFNGILGSTSMLTIADTFFMSDSGNYSCKASNGAGLPATLSRPFQLMVMRVPPRRFCVEAGQPCKNGGICEDLKDSYRCLCTGRFTGQTCEQVIRFVRAPEFIVKPLNTSRPLYSTLSLTCTASGFPQPELRWYKDSRPVSDDDNDDTKFTIRELTLPDRGFYHCEAVNTAGRILSPVAVVNIDNVVQYEATIAFREDFLQEEKTLEMVVEETNEFVAGTIISSNTSLFFISLKDTASSNSLRRVPVIITIITEEGGSDRLLQQVQLGLSNLRVGLQVSINVGDRFDGCRAGRTNITSQSGDPNITLVIHWPETNIGETAVVMCPCGSVSFGAGSLQATRYCGGNFTSGAQWEEEMSAACNFSDRARKICNLAKLEVGARVSALGQLTQDSQNFEATDVSVAAAVLVDATAAVGGNKTLTESFLTVSDNILNVESSTMLESQGQANTSARLLQSIQSVAGDLPVEVNQSSTVVRINFAVSVQRVNTDHFNGFTFTSMNDGGIRTDQTHSAMADNQQSVSISLPPNLISGTNRHNDSVRITNAIFKNDNLFLTGEEHIRVHGNIVAASVVGMRVEGLDPPVVIVFPRGNLSSNVTDILCSFWDHSANGGFGGWSTEGCSIDQSSNDTDDHVICRCNHLTNFAVILDVSPRPINRSTGAVGVALTAISYIGVIVSIVCLLATIITYLGSKALRSTDHGRLLLSLCFALLGLYLSYILAIHGTGVPPLCAMFGALLHYFLLVTFSSMAAEAVNLYMKLVVVLGNQISSYVLKATLVTWIFPAFVVLFCFAPNPTNYIGPHFCRVFGIPFYVGLLAPFLAIYLFNWVLFAVIIFNLLCKECLVKFKESRTSEKKMSIKQQLIITITLSILFGLGWGIGLPATQELHQTAAVKDTFAAFFIILTAFQGLFVFIMHCLRSKEARKLWSQWILKTTGKEVDLSLSVSSQSNYWRQRRQQMRNKSTSTYASYVSSSGTLRKLAVDIDIKTPGSEADHGTPISPCSDVGYELPQLTEKEHWGSHPSITSREGESSETQVCKEPIVITEVGDEEEKAGEKAEEIEEGKMEEDEEKKSKGAKEEDEGEGKEAEGDKLEGVEAEGKEGEGKEVVKEGQQDSPVISSPNPPLHSGEAINGVNHRISNSTSSM